MSQVLCQLHVGRSYTCMISTIEGMQDSARPTVMLHKTANALHFDVKYSKGSTF